MESRATGWRRDLALITLLLLAGLAVKGWLLAHLEIIARDGVGYIDYSARLRQEPWTQVLPTVEQHPLYPINLIWMSKLVEAVHGDANYRTWQWSALLTNSLHGLLLVIPMYLVGKEVFGRRAGFWATLIFEVLPVPAHVTTDALSEGTWLLWAATALLFAVWGLRTRSLKWFTLCGLTGGLAFLARPEGALIVAGTGCILLVFQLRRSGRPAWGKTLACTACLGLASVVVVSPFFLLTGRLSVKPSFGKVLESVQTHADEPPPSAPQPLFAARFGSNDQDAQAEYGAWRALFEVCDEGSKAFHYGLWPVFLVGLFWFRRRLVSDPRLALLVLLGAAQLLILWRLAVVAQYVSERHTLMLVLCGTLVAIGAVFDGLAWLHQRAANADALKSAAAEKNCRRLGWLAHGFIAAVLVVCLIQTSQPRHSHHLSHREAGFWLAKHSQPHDELIDPYGWASFYAERTRAFVPPAEKSPGPRNRYVVVEPGEDNAYRLHRIEKASAKGTGKPVFRWPADTGADLIVYAIPVQR